MGFVMLRRSMGWRNRCLGEWNWGRKIKAKLRGLEFRSPKTANPQIFGRFPGGFGADLLTGKAGKSPKMALQGPILSEPVELDDSVRGS